MLNAQAWNVWAWSVRGRASRKTGEDWARHVLTCELGAVGMKF